MMTASPRNYVVEYRTVGGGHHKWEGAAVDEDKAQLEALNDSFVSMCFDDHWHSLISIEET